MPIKVNVNETMLDDIRTQLEFDNVKRPQHYCHDGIECIDVMQMTFGREATMNFCHLNAFKYVWRMLNKNGSEDAAKAVWYLNKWRELNDHKPE